MCTGEMRFFIQICECSDFWHFESPRLWNEGFLDCFVFVRRIMELAFVKSHSLSPDGYISERYPDSKDVSSFISDQVALLQGQSFKV
jgi:hypothetical protein